MHSVILRNPRLAQRRILFEVLGIFAYAIAVALCVFNILNWTDHSSFVISCTVIWVLFGASVVARLMWTNAASQNDKVLEIPESWDESRINSQSENLIKDELPATNLPVVAITGTNTVEPDAEKAGVQAPQKEWRSRKQLTRFRKKRSSRASVSNLSVYTQKVYTNSTCDCS